MALSAAAFNQNPFPIRALHADLFNIVLEFAGPNATYQLMLSNKDLRAISAFQKALHNCWEFVIKANPLGLRDRALEIQDSTSKDRNPALVAAGFETEEIPSIRFYRICLTKLLPAIPANFRTQANLFLYRHQFERLQQQALEKSSQAFFTSALIPALSAQQLIEQDEQKRWQWTDQKGRPHPLESPASDSKGDADEPTSPVIAYKRWANTKQRSELLRQVTVLDLTDPEFSVSPDLSACQGLTTLSVGSPTSPLALSKEISDLPLLRTLSGYVASFPPNTSEMHSLKILRLSGVATHSLPSEVSTIPHLTTLNASGGNLTIFPEHITEMRELKWLLLHGNAITNIPAKELKDMPSLEFVSLHGNPISFSNFAILIRKMILPSDLNMDLEKLGLTQRASDEPVLEERDPHSEIKSVFNQRTREEKLLVFRRIREISNFPPIENPNRLLTWGQRQAFNDIEAFLSAIENVGTYLRENPEIERALQEFEKMKPSEEKLVFDQLRETENISHTEALHHLEAFSRAILTISERIGGGSKYRFEE